MNRSLSPTLAALSLLALACGKDQPPMPRGVTGSDRGEIVEAEPAPEPAKEEQAPEPRLSGLPSPFAPGPGDLSPTTPTTPARTEAAAPEAPARDLGAELADLARAPGCIDLAAAASQPGGKLTVSVSAYVLETGRITRATVSAPGQPAAALRCAERRITGAGLKGPIPSGAGNVSGIATLEVIGAAPTTVQVQPPDPSRSPYAGSGTSTPSPDQASTTSNTRISGGAIPDEQAGAP